MVRDIEENFFVLDLMFGDSDFRFIVTQTSLEKIGRFPAEQVPPFQCSPGFVTDIQERHQLSSRRFHFKRHPPQPKMIGVSAWQVIREVPPDRIVNCDETGWLLHPRGLLTWRAPSSQSVQVHIRRSEKDSLTIIASVKADGQKLPLISWTTHFLPRKRLASRRPGRYHIQHRCPRPPCLSTMTRISCSSA